MRIHLRGGLRAFCTSLTAVFLMSIVVTSPTSASAQERVLSSGNLALWIDPATCLIKRITHRQFGTLLERTRLDGGIFTVSYPVKVQSPVNPNVLAEYPALNLSPSYDTADSVVSSNPNGVTCTWNQLKTDLGAPTEMRVAAVLAITPRGNNGFTMKLDLQNWGEFQLFQVHFPDLEGFGPFAGRSSTRFRDSRSGAQGAYYPFIKPVVPDGRATFYPVTLWKRFPFNPGSRWVTFEGDARGSLGFGGVRFEQITVSNAGKFATEYMAHRPEAEPDKLRLIWRHEQRIDLNTTWTSGEFVMEAF